MDDYDLEPGEFAIMQTDQACFGDDAYAEQLDELVLSNRNIILVASASVSLFKRVSKTYKLPLKCIACSNGIPQVMTLKKGADYQVQVVFETETISFAFPVDQKRTVERWADAIRRAAVGDLAGIQTEDPAVPKELLDLADGAKQVFGAVFATGAAAAGSASSIPSVPAQVKKAKKPPMVTQKCSGCHAPLSGRKGSMVTCEYCGVKQAL